jgi:hypothetical protein
MTGPTSSKPLPVPAKLFFYPCFTIALLGESLGLKLRVDGKEIPLNDFVEKILDGTITGAINSLRGIKEDWKRIEIEILK